MPPPPPWIGSRNRRIRRSTRCPDSQRAGGSSISVRAHPVGWASGRIECPPTFRTDPGQIVGLIAGDTRSSLPEHREDQSADAVVHLKDIGLQPGDTVLGITAGGSMAAGRTGVRPFRGLPDRPALLCSGGGRGRRSSALSRFRSGLLRIDEDEGGNRDQACPQHHHHRRLHPPRQGPRQPDGGHRATNQKLYDRAIRVLMTYDEGISRARRTNCSPGATVNSRRRSWCCGREHHRKRPGT